MWQIFYWLFICILHRHRCRLVPQTCQAAICVFSSHLFSRIIMLIYLLCLIYVNMLLAMLLERCNKMHSFVLIIMISRQSRKKWQRCQHKQKKPIEFCFSSKQIESVLENNKQRDRKGGTQRQRQRERMMLQLIETNLFVYEEWREQ